MGYGRKDNNFKTLDRYQRQLKRQKLAEKGCESKSQCISSVTCSLLPSDNVATSSLPSTSQFLHSSSDNTSSTLTADSQVEEIPDPGYENEIKSCNCEEEIKRLNAANDYLKTEVTTLKETATYFNQECLRLSKENMALRNQLDKKAFTVSNLDEKKLKFFTGKVINLEFES